MKAYELAERLNDPKSNTVQLIQHAWNTDMEEFFVGLALATNPEIDFRIQSVPLIDEEEGDDYPGTLTFDEFHQMALQLSTGLLTGQDAKKAIESAAMIANTKEWNLWYRRILLKSLSRYLPMLAIQKELIRLTTE